MITDGLCFIVLSFRVLNAHINVKISNSVKCIKYICKYVCKGSDQLTIALTNDNDEVSNFQSGRYISSAEAVWRTLGFAIHDRSPSVMHLAVHLENGQRVYNKNGHMPDTLSGPPVTTLTAFFELCKIDPFALKLLYNKSLYSLHGTRKNFPDEKEEPI